VVDLFTDEQGKMFLGEEVEIAGWLLIHPSLHAAERFHTAEALVDLVRNFPPAPLTGEPKGGPARDRHYRKVRAWKSRLRDRGPEIAEIVANTARSTGTQMRLARLRGAYRYSGSPWELGDEHNKGRDADTLYRAIMSALIEASYFHLVPREVGTPSFSARLFLASLVYSPKKEDGRIATDRVRDASKFGLRPGPRLYYLTGNTPQAIAQGICRSYPGEKPSFDVAGAFSINQHPEESGARPFHYIVDALTDRSNRALAETVAPLLFDGAYAEPLRQLLHAARLGAQGVIGTALAIADAVRPHLPAHDPIDIHTRLLSTTGWLADRMTAADFVQLTCELRPAAGELDPLAGVAAETATPPLR
jgi:hypothetical protein